MTTLDHSVGAQFDGVLDAALAMQPQTVALRREIHRHPEIGLRLPATQAAILRALSGLPLALHTGDGLDSVIAVLAGARPGPTVLLRADMDALPLSENTGLDFASEVDGAMHACGHDTHVAMLASAARMLCQFRDRLAGTVVFMFQPGEELYFGAKYMLAEGLLEVTGQRPVRALALHVDPNHVSGRLRCRPGPMLASADELHVRITGQSGHAAMPHRALDPVPAAAAIVGALQTMVTRQVNVFEPAVVTIAHIQAGATNTNIIPETAQLSGTIRALSEHTRAELHRQIPQVCEHAAAMHGCTAEVTLKLGYGVTVNDDAVTNAVLAVTDAVLGTGRGVLAKEPLMVTEDWSYVLNEVPGAMAFLGACPPEVEPADAAPGHSNRVVFDEAALSSGVAIYTAFALDALR
ncbi:M20 metallopeptidase family protein [Actinocrispum wychmicini]|uniref:Hippurate hydrolase n=1 Tax=Actinocrispum wychmicini TaxID=1213861 RepID=A0A4R2JD11_9PSEU|nr:M20 family metallopeptidase [Actinocrispum wychmicini]TCO54039.1 hippurate hydrolase [Actinocrispum wychmicini]